MKSIVGIILFINLLRIFLKTLEDSIFIFSRDFSWMWVVLAVSWVLFLFWVVFFLVFIFMYDVKFKGDL